MPTAEANAKGMRLLKPGNAFHLGMTVYSMPASRPGGSDDWRSRSGLVVDRGTGRVGLDRCDAAFAGCFGLVSLAGADDLVVRRLQIEHELAAGRCLEPPRFSWRPFGFSQRASGEERGKGRRTWAVSGAVPGARGTGRTARNPATTRDSGQQKTGMRAGFLTCIGGVVPRQMKLSCRTDTTTVGVVLHRSRIRGKSGRLRAFPLGSGW